MKRADKLLLKSYGLRRSFRHFNDLHTAGKESGDYSELIKPAKGQGGEERPPRTLLCGYDGAI